MKNKLLKHNSSVMSAEVSAAGQVFTRTLFTAEASECDNEQVQDLFTQTS